MLASASKRCLSARASTLIPMISSCRSLSQTAGADSVPPLGHGAREITGRVFIDSVFPVRFGAWDLRYYLGAFRQEELLQKVDSILRGVKTHGFTVTSLEPRVKDGGVFAHFKYNGSHETLSEVIEEIKAAGEAAGGFPSWTGLKRISGSVWQVKGEPWLEDLHRFVSPLLRVAFEGPDIREEDLYRIFRPYGRIVDLTPPTPGTGGALRSAVVTFFNVRSAAVAHNCVHGFRVENTGGMTYLHTNFEQPLRRHAVRDWASNHPKIVAPILVFLIGSITYTIFDPLRVFCVEGKLLDWFDYRKSTLYHWLKENTVEKLSFALSNHEDDVVVQSHVWKERQDAENDVHAYLNDPPTTVTFVHGPQGSGKSSMLFSVLGKTERPVLTIDCSEIIKASSDSALLSAIARQTGYWPVFPFVNALNNMIDIASMGLMGQKAGLSTSIEAQVQQMLDVVGKALKAAGVDAVRHSENEKAAEVRAEERRREEIRRRRSILAGTWHDPRADCLAGNGIMSELGVGDELFRPEDGDSVDEVHAFSEGDLAYSEKSHVKSAPETQVNQGKPIVVIKNFATKRGQDVIIAELAKWAASLVQGGVAHVIVVSDNRENAKVLAQALPSKPLHAIALSDADSSSALAFVEQKLCETSAIERISSEERTSIGRLGGRASDLEILVHKVRSGQSIDDAVEDIISRGVHELRKNAFGEDSEDAKNLPWTRDQAWAVLKQLAEKDSISYHSTLIDFPFKNDEMALRSMESAELISIVNQNGRPSLIRPGRPVYRYVFQRLAADPVFRAMQELSFNTAKISSADSTVRACEDELAKISSLSGSAISSWWRNPLTDRSKYLLKKLRDAERTLEKLEAANADLKKTLSKAS